MPKTKEKFESFSPRRVHGENALPQPTWAASTSALGAPPKPSEVDSVGRGRTSETGRDLPKGRGEQSVACSDELGKVEGKPAPLRNVSRDTPCRYTFSTPSRCRRGGDRCVSHAALPHGSPSDRTSSAGEACLRQGFDAAHQNAWTRLPARLADARIGRTDRSITGRDTPCRCTFSTSGRCRRGRDRCGRFSRTFWAASWAECRRRPRFPPCPWQPAPA